MKGLLRKELYMTWAYSKVFLFMILCFLLAGGLSQDKGFFLVYPMIIGMILPVSNLSYDERFKWHLSCDAMPCSRAKYVSAKYLMALLSVLAVMALTLLIQALRLSRTGSLAQLWTYPALLLPVGFIGPALLMPVIFWLGVEKGRIFYFVLVGFVCAVGVVMGGGTGLSLGVAPASPLLLLLASALLFAGSWLLSVRLYEKREL